MSELIYPQECLCLRLSQDGPPGDSHIFVYFDTSVFSPFLAEFCGLKLTTHYLGELLHVLSKNAYYITGAYKQERNTAHCTANN